MTKGLFFLSAWCRARQNVVPSQQAIARIIEEPSGVMLAQIADTEYAPYLSLGEESVEKMIEAERDGFLAILQKFNVDGEVIDLLFMRVRMERVAQELKARLFEGKEKKKTNDPEIKRGLEMRFSNPAEIDDWIINRFEELSIEKARKIGDIKLALQLKLLFRKRRLMRSEGVEDGVVLREMEDAFLRKADLTNGGVAPAIALMVRKMRVERMLRIVMGARRLGMDFVAVQYEISKIRGIV